MRKEVKGFIIGAITTTMLFSTVAFADTVKKNIEVVLNSVNITVNGQKVQADNILYNGTTYVPLRTIGEMLGKEIGWDGNTSTASINDKAIVTEAKKTADKNEYIIRDANGKALYSFKINKVSTMNDRNQYSDKNPAQVILIDYTYENIANTEEVYLSEIYFKVIDSKGKMGYTYPNSKTDYPQRIPIGATCDAQMIFGIDNQSDTIKLAFYENMFKDMTTSFELPIK